jgi:hypothetical protein
MERVIAFLMSIIRNKVQPSPEAPLPSGERGSIGVPHESGNRYNKKNIITAK